MWKVILGILIFKEFTKDLRERKRRRRIKPLKGEI